MNDFPYTNFHELNQDWILKQTKSNTTDISIIKETISNIPPDVESEIATINRELDELRNEIEDISSLYLCTFGITTNSEIETALNDKKLPICIYSGHIYVISERASANRHRFGCVYRTESRALECLFDAWLFQNDTFASTTYVDSAIASIPPDVFIAEYEVTSYADLLSAYNSGKYLVVKEQLDPDFPDADYAVFCGFESDEFFFYEMNPTTRQFNRYRRNATDWYKQQQGQLALTASPHFTGIPTAPTASLGTNTTQIASTAFVQQEINNIPGVTPLYPYTGFPSPLGTAFPGTSADYSRGDHIHAMPSASDVGAIPAPASPSTGQFLSWNGNNWVATSLPIYNGGVI